MCRIIFLLFSVITLFYLNNFSSEIHPDNFCYVINGANIDEIAHSEYEMAVIDYSYDGSENGKYKKKDIQKLIDEDIIPLCYLSIGEAEDYRFYWQNAWYKTPPYWLDDENPDWQGNYKVRYWKAEWKDILKSYLEKIIAQGFKGIYLDIIDAYYYWSEIKGDLSVKFAANEMLNLIKMIKDYTSKLYGEDFLIFIQNGEELSAITPEITNYINGLGIEELLFTEGKKNAIESVEYRMKHINYFRHSEITVLLIEYISEGESVDIQKSTYLKKFASENNFLYYIADRNLELDSLISLSE